MFHDLWPGGPKFKQTDAAFPLSTDSVLLADFAGKIKARRILDLGCGAGALCVLLRVSHPDAEIGGIEVQPEAAALARENLEGNGFDASGIVTGDLREHRTLWKAGAFDLVVSNPPYFPAGSGKRAPNPSRAAAREESCTPDELCAAAAYLCKNGGAFALVHRPARLSELFCAMTAHGLEPKRLRLVQYRAGYAPNLVLIEGRRGGKPGLDIEKPLILCDDGGESEEYKRIYHKE